MGYNDLMNEKGASTVILVIVFLAFLATAGLAYHYKMQRDTYYNQLNGLTNGKAHSSL